MGTQINVEVQDLLDAGWTLRVEEESYPLVDDEGTEYTERARRLVINKDGFEFWSYAPDSFCADANNWGTNKSLSTRAGLFDLPHTLS